MIENLCSLYVGRKKFLKINKRDVPNKGVMVGKSSEEQINVQHVYQELQSTYFPLPLFLQTSKSFIKPYDLRFNEVDKPKGPPYVLDRPGALSFNAGPLR